MFGVFYGQQKGALHRKSTDESEKHTRTHTHLEFHLLSLLGVNSHNMLVVSECVSAVLLLCSHVSLQGLQHPLGLEGEVEEMSCYEEGIYMLSVQLLHISFMCISCSPQRSMMH